MPISASVKRSSPGCLLHFNNHEVETAPQLLLHKGGAITRIKVEKKLEFVAADKDDKLDHIQNWKKKKKKRWE